MKTGPLSPNDWAELNRHPELGAELLQSLPPMGEAAVHVRAHHERWDGEGYPDGLRGDSIPLPSRVVAVCDAFVAMATDRPYRRGIGAGGAIEHILLERGAQFDPRAVDCLFAAITGKRPPRQRALVDDRGPATRQPAPVLRLTSTRARELRRAIAKFDAVPAFGPSVERTLSATAFGGVLGAGELTSAVETDIGVTIAILRAAHARSPVPAASVASAVRLVRPEEIRDAVARLPTMAFPSQTKFEALLLRERSHAQAVARAAERIAQMLRPFARDEVVTAALLHDIGKLLLARVRPGFTAPSAVRHPPAEVVRQERRELGFDHASLGGLMLQRWGLPSTLVSAVSGHHSAEAATETAALVRLADIVVHHAQGDAIDRHVMLRLAAASDVSVEALRGVIVDLPRSSGGAIAEELELSESTVRTHLHNIYAKLKVADRAQAVLRAT